MSSRRMCFTFHRAGETHLHTPGAPSAPRARPNGDDRDADAAAPEMQAVLMSLSMRSGILRIPPCSRDRRHPEKIPGKISTFESIVSPGVLYPLAALRASRVPPTPLSPPFSSNPYFAPFPSLSHPIGPQSSLPACPSISSPHPHPPYHHKARFLRSPPRLSLAATFHAHDTLSSILYLRVLSSQFLRRVQVVQG